jgi:hypothetical protein
VIQHVEKLCPELQAGALRNLPDREVLVDREIQVDERRTDDAVAPGIANEFFSNANGLGLGSRVVAALCL